MFKVLIDTCVWLDIAKEPKQAAVLDVVDEMIRLGLVTLIVPRIVLDEFRRNRDRIAREGTKSMSSHFKLVKDAVGKAGGDRKKIQAVISHLDDVDRNISIVGGTATASFDRIEKLLTASTIIESSEAVKLRAVQRAIEKKAPFHHNKNSMADAIIIETYAEFVRDKTLSGIRFAFITHNKNDFSIENGNQKIPHSDFANIFSRIKSLYFINLPEALRRIDPSLVTDILLESSWMQEARGLAEMLQAEDLLFNQVWYNRHWNMRSMIDDGKIKVVDKEIFPRVTGSQETIQRNILKDAIRAARNVERRYGKKNLGPWDDFEWGMINGKLSALRWALGDEWDMLDT
jgi:hypothetical protein